MKFILITFVSFCEQERKFNKRDELVIMQMEDFHTGWINNIVKEKQKIGAIACLQLLLCYIIYFVTRVCHNKNDIILNIFLLHLKNI